MPIIYGALIASGLLVGVLSGLLGIGGGTVIVPILITLGYPYDQAVAISSLSIIITSLSGSIQNWRMGYLDFKRVMLLGLPAILTAQVGVLMTKTLADPIKLLAFAALLTLTIALVSIRKQLAIRTDGDTKPVVAINPLLARLLTGSLAGLLAGLFGVGGGVIMVPLQMLLLGETIKRSIQTSLGVIVLTAIAATVGHAIQGNVVWLAGILLGFGGLIGAQVSTRVLPKLPDRVVTTLFRSLLIALIVYTLWQAWQLAFGS